MEWRNVPPDFAPRGGNEVRVQNEAGGVGLRVKTNQHLPRANAFHPWLADTGTRHSTSLTSPDRLPYCQPREASLPRSAGN